ncbi:hypothetical protein BFW86_17600 [Pseudomonas fluorescens]|nr:hypothetical protein BFW86_17600 [Pseudomonas fluorescens]
MNSVSKTKLKTTSGTAAAVITGDDYFENFKGLDFYFYLEESVNKWAIWSATAYDQHDQAQLISLLIPNDGDVVKRTYEIIDDVLVNDKAVASWAKLTSSTYRPYGSVSGTVTITLDTRQQTAELIFEFEAKSGGQKVMVTAGKMSVKDFWEGRTITQAGSVKCQLSDAVTADYASTTTLLAKRPESPIFPEHMQVWSQQLTELPGSPLPTDYRLALNIAKGVSPGTYPFTSDSRQVRLFFYDINRRLTWIAESGEIKLTSIPNFETLEGALSGAFSFTGTVKFDDGSEGWLTGQNGKFDIQQ